MKGIISGVLVFVLVICIILFIVEIFASIYLAKIAADQFEREAERGESFDNII